MVCFILRSPIIDISFPYVHTPDAMSEEAANIARACGLDPQDVAKANGMKYTPAA